MSENKNTPAARAFGVAIPAAFDETAAASAEHARRAGFQMVSLVWNREDRTALARDAAAMRAAGLTVTSVHGPFLPQPGIPGGVNSLWEGGEIGDEFADVIMDCVEDTAAAGIPLMVQHPNFASFPIEPSAQGIARFRRIGEHAAAVGVRIAVENMELPALFTAMMDELDPAVFGMCWDCGHNFAYTPQFDPLARYPGRVLTIHLHDNDGKTTEGAPDTRDDAHFLPFDGKIDWASAMARLAAAGYDGPIMLEVKSGRPPCKKIAAYAEIGEARFFEEAYRRAQRLSQLFR